jgi:hypothetical protein
MRQLWREWQESQDDDAEHDSADSASGDEGNAITLPYPHGPRTLQFARASALAPTHTRAWGPDAGGRSGDGRLGGGGGRDGAGSARLGGVREREGESERGYAGRTLVLLPDARGGGGSVGGGGRGRGGGLPLPQHLVRGSVALSGDVMTDIARGRVESGRRLRLQGHRQGQERGGAVRVLGRARHDDTGERAWRSQVGGGGVSDAMVARWVAAGVRKRRV